MNNPEKTIIEINGVKLEYKQRIGSCWARNKSLV